MPDTRQTTIDSSGRRGSTSPTQGAGYSPYSDAGYSPDYSPRSSDYSSRSAQANSVAEDYPLQAESVPTTHDAQAGYASQQPHGAQARQVSQECPSLVGSYSQQDAPTQAYRSTSQPYVRQRAPHKTQPPVTDSPSEEAFRSGVSYDTSYTFKNMRQRSSHSYRRSRSDVMKVRRELKYGQYLSVPKGNHEIFSARDRIRRKQIAVALIAVAAIAIVVLIFMFMPH